MPMSKRRKKGQGSAYLRPDGRWEGEIKLGTDEFGRPVRKYASGASSEEVLNRLAELKEEHLRQGSRQIPAISASLTFGRFVEEYFYPSVQQSVTGRTM